MGSESLQIENYLLRGRENALSLRELRRITGLHPRKITESVQRARRRGVPVLSSSHPGGYFIAATTEEKTRFERSMRHRARETLVTLRYLRQARVEGDAADG